MVVWLIGAMAKHKIYVWSQVYPSAAEIGRLWKIDGFAHQGFRPMHLLMWYQAGCHPHLWAPNQRYPKINRYQQREPPASTSFRRLHPAKICSASDQLVDTIELPSCRDLFWMGTRGFVNSINESWRHPVRDHPRWSKMQWIYHGFPINVPIWSYMFLWVYASYAVNVHQVAIKQFFSSPSLSFRHQQMDRGSGAVVRNGGFAQEHFCIGLGSSSNSPEAKSCCRV